MVRISDEEGNMHVHESPSTKARVSESEYRKIWTS